MSKFKQDSVPLLYERTRSNRSVRTAIGTKAYIPNEVALMHGKYDGKANGSNHIHLGAGQSIGYPILNDGGANSYISYYDVDTKSTVQLTPSAGTTYNMTASHSGYATHTKALTANELAECNANPQAMAEVWFSGRVLVDGFKKSDIVNYFMGNEGVNGGAYVYDLCGTQEISDIGAVGTLGFGVGAIDDSELPSGWTKLDGHHDTSSANYGNVTDNTGSVMVWIPAFWFRWNVDNTVQIAPGSVDGYQIHRAFIDGGLEKDGFFVDKYGCGNVAGVFASKQGIDPCSTHADHNPIADLNNTPPNRYGGLYKAVKTRSAGHLLTSIFIYNALTVLAHAQGKAGTNCAFADVSPLHPKGCNNNALKDTNDSSVTFTGSGYSNCAMTGSGVPFAKTTHNGQECGVADLNGNMWEVASGFIKYGTGDAVFKILKESTKLSDILDDTTTQASGGAYDIDLYDDLDLTGSMAADTSSRFGNGSGQVFMMNTDRDTEQYKMTTAGLPMIGGCSAGGTTEFGNDYYREYWRNEMAPIVGGYWNSTSSAGVFSLTVTYYRPSSNSTVGGRASVYL